MNRPIIEDIFAQKPEARPRIYAYSIADTGESRLELQG